MNIAFKIMIFTIFLNIGSGIISTYYTPAIGFGQTGSYQDLDSLADKTTVFKNQSNIGSTEGSGDAGWFDDWIGIQALNLITKMIDLLGSFLYGINDMLEPILVPIGLEWVNKMIFIVINVVYFLSILNLISGKSINGEG